MRTNSFFIFLHVSIASLMQLIQASVEFDQLLEVRNTIQWCNEKKKNLIKSYIITQLLAFFMKQNNMYVTTSRCDDYPTSMNSQETIKEERHQEKSVATTTTTERERHQQTSVAASISSSRQKQQAAPKNRKKGAAAPKSRKMAAAGQKCRSTKNPKISYKYTVNRTSKWKNTYQTI